MADTKITGLTENTTPALTDLAPMVDDPAGTPLTQKITISNLLGTGGGWIAAGETWTYASADDPTFTFTVAGVDLTSKYSAGMRIKLTQTTVKYFIITAVAFSTNTTNTVYGGTDYDLADAAITSPYYSTQKAPQGFPLDPTKWTVEVTDVANRSQATATAGTWYNLGSLTVSIPIGSWRTTYKVNTNVSKASVTANDIQVTFSTANNSESDVDFSYYSGIGDLPSAATFGFLNIATIEKYLTLSSKTSYYLNAKTGTNGSTIQFRGDLGKTIIRAVCAYL